MITLNDALKNGDLESFIRQQEAAGMPVPDETEVLRALEVAAKSPRPADQTLRSASAGASTGKRTR
jgi:hypothetical protein